MDENLRDLLRFFFEAGYNRGSTLHSPAGEEVIDQQFSEFLDKNLEGSDLLTRVRLVRR